jgi:superfamily II DNA or RNA helicase
VIDIEAARRLLDFGARIGSGQRADEQLQGAVALYHLLENRRVAYLADEVGMGKTYVALGTWALFRHFRPDFRVLVIAPRENIQLKWMKELKNFVAHNVRFADLRIKAIDGRPARPITACANLLEFVRETARDPNRDFFLRLSSFSMALRGEGDGEDARHFRNNLRRHLPWLADEALDLRNKQAFKDNVAAAVCCALPKFDLVIVDEAHNLKRGFHAHVSARNRVLALMMGRADERPDPKCFRGFGPRASRVLFLSATPVEEAYRQLWNQLDVFGMGRPFDDLCESTVEEEKKKELVGTFLIRRVTSIRIGESDYTKNLYRREWRKGGVDHHDEPIRITDLKQRLTVGLVQKKVSEILGSARFNSSFQIGMLASFESFLQTAKVKTLNADESNFDDAEQTESREEKQGIDVQDVNRLASSHREVLGREMPHPKMDALVDSLVHSWRRGQKSLIFVRRVASVKELKRKLDERYDDWLIDRLRHELPPVVQPRLERLWKEFRAEKKTGETWASRSATDGEDAVEEIEQDGGGNDTFFAWFFRGKGPRAFSGAHLQRWLRSSTFFEDNFVADLLRCRPGEVESKLSTALAATSEELRPLLRERSKRFLTKTQKTPRVSDRFEAVQAAAVEWLSEMPGEHQAAARVVWHQRFESSLQASHAARAPEIDDLLERRTFFSELRLRPDICKRIWPESQQDDPLEAFRERSLRAQLLASAARLGHGLIDLYVRTIHRLGSLELRAQEVTDDRADKDHDRIDDYIQLLDEQRRSAGEDRPWSAFDELAEIASHYELILDCNASDIGRMRLQETAKYFGQLLGRQQPIGGMHGQLNQTLVRQFRMPGYPLVLVTTDLLQEGEDLHTFCSAVHHYGISWTPSSMEQRIGRIDRVRSQTDRRLSALPTDPAANEFLQVYFPHLQDTVEVLQVERVLQRMNVFLRLMHEGLLAPFKEDPKIDVKREFAKTRRDIEQIRERLVSAFPVRSEWLQGTIRDLVVAPEHAERLQRRFAGLTVSPTLPFSIRWERQLDAVSLLGTAQLKRRIQPFALILRSVAESAVVRCISPVGRVTDESQHEVILNFARSRPGVRIGLIQTDLERTYDLTVESDVLLTDLETHDAERLRLLLERVLPQADDLEHALRPEDDAPLPRFQKDMETESQHER